MIQLRMDIELKDDERIDDLQCNGYKIIQNNKGFCFGIDSILLANFASNIKNNSNVVDLGTGTGILSILLCAKNNINKVTGIEIQKEVAEMANRSVALNNLQEKIKIENCNIKDIFENNIIEKNSIDVVISNPPYKEINTGVMNCNEKKLISRHEIKANLADFISVSSKLLKDKGILYMVHKPERTADIICKLRKNKLEPKEIRYVYPNINDDANLVLIKAVKGANKFLKVDKALFIYKDVNIYSDEINEIYNSRK